MSWMSFIFLIKNVLKLSYQRHAVLKKAISMSGILDFFHSLFHDVFYNSFSSTAASLWRIRVSTRRSI